MWSKCDFNQFRVSKFQNVVQTSTKVNLQCEVEPILIHLRCHIINYLVWRTFWYYNILHIWHKIVLISHYNWIFDLIWTTFWNFDTLNGLKWHLLHIVNEYLSFFEQHFEIWHPKWTKKAFTSHCKWIFELLWTTFWNFDTLNGLKWVFTSHCKWIFELVWTTFWYDTLNSQFKWFLTLFEENFQILTYKMD